MMFKPEQWASIDANWLANFAQDWLVEIRLGASQGERDVGMEVVAMNFTAPAEIQWTFILAAVAAAKTNNELNHIAAGPIEHLLGWYGADYIDRVEAQSTSDAKFARTLTTVRQYLMDDRLWARVQAIQGQVPDPRSKS